jgi:hypothetical protein
VVHSLCIIGLVFKFWAKSPQKVPISSEPEIDRVEETYREWKAAQAVLHELDEEIRLFRGLHGILNTDGFDRIIDMRGDSILAKARVEPLWREIQQRKGRALHEFSRTLQNWNQAKETAQNDKTKCAA